MAVSLSMPRIQRSTVCSLFFMQVTNRSDCGAATALIHFFIRPFAPHLTKIKKVYGPCSPRLTPLKSAYKKCDIRERLVEDIWVYDIMPKNASQKDGQKRTKRIYNFAGGSWQSSPTGNHFRLLSILAHRLFQPTIVCGVLSKKHPTQPPSSTFRLDSPSWRELNFDFSHHVNNDASPSQNAINQLRRPKLVSPCLRISTRMRGLT